MTQSGQSEEPSQRQAREGIVLPSDGGEPLLPGMLGNQARPQNVSPQGHQGGSHTAQYGGPYAGQQPGPQTPASAPPGGQSWGTPWGPDRQETAPPEPGQGWDAPPAQSWGTPGPYQPPATDQWNAGPQPLPQEGAPSASYGGAAQPMPGASPHDGYAPAAHQPTSGSPLPPANPYPGAAPGTAAGGYGAAGSGATMPPAQPMGQDAQQPAGYGAPAAFGAPLPPADEGATQLIPPVTGGAPGSEGATQYLPPVPAAPADEGATQFLPPVGPGALPPETGGHHSGEATQFLGRPDLAGAGPLPSAADPDAQATQFIPPVGDHRQPPAEFDNLFRGGPGGEAPAGSTQQLPRFEQPQPQPAYGGPQSSYFPPGRDDDGGRGGRGGRTKSRVPLIAAVGIGIVVLGVGAGALLGGGGGGDGKDKNQPVSATAPAGDGSASPSADPAKQQAVALDKLLADSGNSRASVINAVADVKACRNLGGAASDLRAAAKQRGELVTRLAGLSVDRLPAHADLTTALTKAWQASASADNHYAAWADQVGGRKGCHKGQARATGQTAAGNAASGTASQQKLRASRLWNAIAKSYGLTQRGPTQL
ncbi:hypothetical protein ACQF4J_25755 [Streptomyces sp. C1-1]|uniref:hypothetical protein n=1 Tax=Streptomyces sp. C1-1 TaxID=3231173 RepID=UPI003CFC7863